MRRYAVTRIARIALATKTTGTHPPGGWRADAPRIALTKIGAASYALDVTSVGRPQRVQLATAPACVSEE